MKRISTLIVLICVHCSGIAFAQTMPIEECKRIQERIEHYNDLRRKGGSSSQMDSWRASRKKWEDKFREGECKKHGNAVR